MTSVTREMARAYYRLLTSLPWQDETLITGLREGLNKFLSNVYLSLLKGNKYHKTHYVSFAALERLQRKAYRGLVFEHLVPKRHHIQSLCEDHARAGTLTVEYIESLLNDYWKLATITKDEDARLAKYMMPVDWNENDVFARYTAVGIQLTANPFASHVS